MSYYDFRIHNSIELFLNFNVNILNLKIICIKRVIDLVKNFFLRRTGTIINGICVRNELKKGFINMNPGLQFLKN